MKTSSYILLACIAMAVTMSITNYEMTKRTYNPNKLSTKKAIAGNSIKKAAERAISDDISVCSATSSSIPNSVQDNGSWFTTLVDPVSKQNTCISCNPADPKWIKWEYENTYGQDNWTATELDALLGTFVPSDKVPAWILRNNC